MKRGKQGTVRIIAGQWRGTRLPIPDLPGLRPSGDRGRETLFNWLQASVRGARCADLFAGSGVLGLEAASRGAAQVTLIEKDVVAARHIQATIDKLGAEQVRCVHSDALQWLRDQPEASLDIVFIDPPFGQGLAEKALALLEEHRLVAEGDGSTSKPRGTRLK